MLGSLQRLRTADLDSLAGALRSGRLAPPYAALSVGRFVAHREAADAVTADIRAADADGFSSRHIADIVAALVADRRARETEAGTRVELVWSGPEMPGMTNRDTPVVVRELFTTARREVLVAGFAVYQAAAIFRPLAEAMDQRSDLQVTFFLDIQRPYGDTTAPSELVHRFAHRFTSKEWPGNRLPDIYYDPRSLELDATKRACLHAKCIVVDATTALVSSANFTEAAHQRNIEVGVLVRNELLARQLRAHLLSLVASGLVRRLPPSGQADDNRTT